MKKQSRYKNVRIGGKLMYEHRYVWTTHNGPIPKGMQVHHINSNKHDNRIENLQLVTNKVNHNKSDRWGKGYMTSKRLSKLKYKAYRTIGNKCVHLGYFGTPCGAYMASRMAYV